MIKLIFVSNRFERDKCDTHTHTHFSIIKSSSVQTTNTIICSTLIYLPIYHFRCAYCTIFHPIFMHTNALYHIVFAATVLYMQFQICTLPLHPHNIIWILDYYPIQMHILHAASYHLTRSIHSFNDNNEKWMDKMLVTNTILYVIDNTHIFINTFKFITLRHSLGYHILFFLVAWGKGGIYGFLGVVVIVLNHERQWLQQIKRKYNFTYLHIHNNHIHTGTNIYV